MKKRVYMLFACASMAVMSMVFTGCKEDKDEVEEVDTTNVRTHSTEVTSPPAGGNENSFDGQTGSDDGSLSGDASNMRSENTASAKSGNVHAGANNKKKNLKGYSAPDGTRDENNDGDMYTKHDTTMMPSGNTPIK